MQMVVRSEAYIQGPSHFTGTRRSRRLSWDITVTLLCRRSQRRRQNASGWLSFLPS